MSAAGVPSRPDTIYQEYRVYSIPSGSKSHYCFPESDAQLPDKLIQITNAAGTGSSRKVREIEGLYEVLRPLMQARLNKYPNEDEVDRYFNVVKIELRQSYRCAWVQIVKHRLTARGFEANRQAPKLTNTLRPTSL
ncbi:hypothetical protein EMMF5_004168 [Cystobasidiomycetes sp. EMM_F5]